MNSGERLNDQEAHEAYTRDENIDRIWKMPAIPVLVEWGISANEIMNKEIMDDQTVDALRARLEEYFEEKAKADAEPVVAVEPPAVEADSTESTGNDSGEEGSSDAEGTPAEEEGPALTPPPVPAGVVIGEESGEDAEESQEDEAEEGAPAEAPEAPAGKPEKRGNIWKQRMRRIGAVVAATAALAVILTSSGPSENSNATNNGLPTPTGYEQQQQEVSYEFDAFEGTDYRGLFLNDEGNGYNEAKQSYRRDPATGEYVLETNWKYDISPRVLDELKVDYFAGDQDNAELGARHTIYSQLVREPEFLAIVANQLGDEDKALLGLEGITTVQGMEAALENPDTLATAEAGIATLFEHQATGKFTTFSGNATNYYLRSNNESNIQNDTSNIEAARTATRYYNNVDVFIIHMSDGSDIIFDIDCLNVVIPVEEGTPEEEVETGTPIIEIEIDDPDPTPTPEPEPDPKPDPDPTPDPKPNPDPDPTPDPDPDPTPTPEPEPDPDPDPEPDPDPDPTPTPEPEPEEPPKGEDPHASDPDLGPGDNGGGEHIPDTDLDDEDGDAPVVSEEEARDANEGNEGYEGGAGDGTGGGAQLPGSSSGSETVNPGTEGADGSGNNGGSRPGTPAEESAGFNGETTDYTEGLETDAGGNQAQEDANAEAAQGGGNGGAEGNYTDSEEEALVQGGNF